MKNDWRKTTIGNELVFQYGKGLPKKSREDGKYPVYGSNGIVGYHKSYLIDKPSLIIGRKGSIGEVHISQEPFWPIDTTYYVTPPTEIDLKFIYYYFKLLPLDSLDTSTAIPGLSRNDAYKIKMLLPKKEEQQKIVERIEELFSVIDNINTTLIEYNTKSTTYKKSLLNYSFNPGKDWNKEKIGKITLKVNKINPKDFPTETFSYFDISSVNNKTNKIIEPKKFLGINAPSRARQVVISGDILFSTVRTYLKNIAIVPDGYNNELGSTGFSVLRTNSTVFNKYLFYYLLSDRFIENMNSFQRGSSYPAVRDDDVKDQFIYFPDLNIQKNIVEKLNSQFSVLASNMLEIQNIREKVTLLKQSILKQAFEGRLV